MALRDKYYTVSQTAKELDATRQTIHRWIRSGKLNAERVGRETLIEKTEVTRFKEDKIKNSVYSMFDMSIARDNYQLLRSKLGYSNEEKIEILNNPKDLEYIVTKPSGEQEKISIKKFGISLDKRHSTLESKLDLKDITKELYEIEKTDKSQ